MPEWYREIRTPLLYFQSLIGVGLFAYSLKLRIPRWQAAAWIALGAAVCYLTAQIFYVSGQDLVSTLRRIAGVMVVYFAVIAVVKVCCRASLWTCLFVTSSGYIAQDIAGSTKSLLKLIPPVGALAEHDLGILLVDLVCYGGVFTILFFAFRPYTRQREENFDDKLKAIFSFGVLLLCIGMARLTQDNPERNLTAQFTESLYSVLCGVFILLLQFGTMERAKLHHSVDAMKEMLHQQRQQYEVGKASMDLVNEKYHDLKALLRSFHGQIPSTQLEELEHSVDQYDLYIHTGSQVLDVLLTEKRTLCAARDIRLTCFLDGTQFSFVEELDLYSLVGNALNNAIEAVSALPPEEERFITLTASLEGGLLTVHMDNPYAGQLRFQEGLPQTSGDPRYHGYGLKSMEHIAQKYGGTLSVTAQEGLFQLDILLPAGEKAARPA